MLIPISINKKAINVLFSMKFNIHNFSNLPYVVQFCSWRNDMVVSVASWSNLPPNI